MNAAVPILLLALAAAGRAQDPAAYGPIQDPEAAGRELALRVSGTPPSKNAEFTGVLRVLVRDTQREVPIACDMRIRSRGPDVTAWDAIYRTQPTGAPPETLVVRFQLGHSNQYFYARGDAARQPVDSLPAVTGTNLWQSLAQSDFALADLGLEFLHWPKQRVLRTEMRRGQVCRVLESVNPAPAEGGYARVLSWVARPGSDAEGILQAEAYDRSQRLAKEFSLGSFKKVGGEWQLKDMKIASPQLHSRTWLEFDLKR